MQARLSDRSYLARLATAQEYAGNAGQIIGALAGSNVWSFSVTCGLLHGQLLWLFTFCIACTLAVLAFRMTQEKDNRESLGAAAEVSENAEGYIIINWDLG